LQGVHPLQSITGGGGEEGCVICVEKERDGEAVDSGGDLILAAPALERSSTTKVKRSGLIGSPCLTPLRISKGSERLSLTMILAVEPLSIAWMRVMALVGKPMCSRMMGIALWFTES
jgi:hypothetical protein